MTPLNSQKNSSDNDVTVLISVYNGNRSLDDALSSVFNQTLQPLNVVAVNDASTDDSQAILIKWQLRFTPDHFLIINNSKNLGLTKSLNLGLAKCRSKYVARIDADDIWSPNKLTRQLKFLQKNPSVGVIGSWYANISTHSSRNFKLPITDAAIKRNIFRLNPFGHSCVVIRKKLLDQLGGYDPNIKYSQDRDLWFRLMRLTNFHNLPYYLCQRRTVNNISTLKPRQQMWQSFKTRFHYIREYHAPLYNYVFLLLPLAIIVKSLLFSSRNKPQQAPLLNSRSMSNQMRHDLIFINDRPLTGYRAETIARQAMAKAFTRHNLIKSVSIKNISPWQSLFVKLSKECLVLYLRCGSVTASIIALRLFFTWKIIIIEVHNMSADKINPLASFLYHLSARRMDLFITIDPLSTSTWIKYGVAPDNILELPSATTSHKQLTQIDKNAVLKKYSLPQNKKIIVYCGNLYRHRGIEDILQSAHVLNNKPYVFVIAGGTIKDVGYYKQYIQTKFHHLDNVLFLSHIPHSQVMSLLSTADLILVTYSKKCSTVATMSPIKLIEALSVHTNVLAADLPRIRAISNNHNVSYYSPDSAQSLTQNINKIFLNNAKRINYKSLFKFTWKDRTNSILDKLLS